MQFFLNPSNNTDKPTTVASTVVANVTANQTNSSSLSNSELLNILQIGLPILGLLGLAIYILALCYLGMKDKPYTDESIYQAPTIASA